MNDYAMEQFRKIYKAFMVEGAKFCWEFDIPECPCTAKVVPPNLIYYTDMPAALKIYNTYRMRAIGYWLGKNGIQVINNVRWGTPETYKYCFLGIPQNTMVCVSTVGCLGDKHDEDRFTEGLAVMVETLNPSHILMYGKRGRNFFDKYIERGTSVKFYDPPSAQA